MQPATCSTTRTTMAKKRRRMWPSQCARLLDLYLDKRLVSDKWPCVKHKQYTQWVQSLGAFLRGKGQ